MSSALAAFSRLTSAFLQVLNLPACSRASTDMSYWKVLKLELSEGAAGQGKKQQASTNIN